MRNRRGEMERCVQLMDFGDFERGEAMNDITKVLFAIESIFCP
jgi:hypothetical protein